MPFRSLQNQNLSSRSTTSLASADDVDDADANVPTFGDDIADMFGVQLELILEDKEEEEEHRLCRLGLGVDIDPKNIINITIAITINTTKEKKGFHI